MGRARVGPALEHLPDDPCLDRAFAHGLAAIGDGSFRFPVPFDLVTSAILADHHDRGEGAELTFAARHAVTHGRARKIRVQVSEIVEGAERCIADCTLPFALAGTTLAQIAAELDHHREGHDE